MQTLITSFFKLVIFYILLADDQTNTKDTNNKLGLYADSKNNLLSNGKLPAYSYTSFLKSFLQLFFLKITNIIDLLNTNLV